MCGASTGLVPKDRETIDVVKSARRLRKRVKRRVRRIQANFQDLEDLEGEVEGEELQEMEDEELGNGELELLEEGEEELEYEADPLDLWDPLDAPSSQLSIAVNMSFLIFSASKKSQDDTRYQDIPGSS
eukprot:Skav219406  [mRNA]  locus=scaffold1139:121988:125923:+ [translate_table: standard]